jgi:hypothetical protein
MRVHFGRCLFAGLIALAALGCEPTPVVVNPEDDDATIIKEEEVEVTPDTTTTPPADTGTRVDVGIGEGGVDVNVDRSAPAEITPQTPPSETNQDTNPNP